MYSDVLAFEALTSHELRRHFSNTGNIVAGEIDLSIYLRSTSVIYTISDKLHPGYVKALPKIYHFK